MLQQLSTPRCVSRESQHPAPPALRQRGPRKGGLGAVPRPCVPPASARARRRGGGHVGPLRGRRRGSASRNVACHAVRLRVLVLARRAPPDRRPSARTPSEPRPSGVPAVLHLLLLRPPNGPRLGHILLLRPSSWHSVVSPKVGATLEARARARGARALRGAGQPSDKGGARPVSDFAPGWVGKGGDGTLRQH